MFTRLFGNVTTCADSGLRNKLTQRLFSVIPSRRVIYKSIRRIMSTNTVPLKDAAPSPQTASSVNSVSVATESNSEENSAAQPSSIRYHRLTQISKRALQESFKHFTYEKLASCYPNIASTPGGKHALEQALLQITKFFQDTALQEFEAIYEERNVQRLMSELDVLIEEARRRQLAQKDASKTGIAPENAPVNLDQLTPEAIIQAHLLPLQKAEEARLKEELAELKRDNQLMLTSLINGNQRAMALLENLSKAVTDLKATNKNTDQMPPREEIVASIQDMTNTSN